MFSGLWFCIFKIMEPLAKKELDKLVHLIFDDLLDDCAIGEKKLHNGARLAARLLIKDAIRIKQHYLEELEEIDNDQASKDAKIKFRSLSASIRRKSLSLVERMDQLGI